MPYKYVVSVGSKGFDEAPCEILRALGRLSWATEKAVSTAGHQPLSPNELLLLGYLEGMKIGVRAVILHSKGEEKNNDVSTMMMENPRLAQPSLHCLLVPSPPC